MKVILLEDVRKVGKKDEVVNVSDGYARNFLIPKKLALPSTASNMKALQKKKDQQAADEKALEEQARAIRDELEKMQLEFVLNVGKEGNTFGTVSSKQIAQELAKKGYNVDRRKILIEDAVSSLGTTVVKVDLYRGKVLADLKVHVGEKKV